jgi:hypothetical protein
MSGGGPWGAGMGEERIMTEREKLLRRVAQKCADLARQLSESAGPHQYIKCNNQSCFISFLPYCNFK